MKALAVLTAACAACASLVAVVGGAAAVEPCQPGDTLVSIRNYAFSPGTVTVPPGTTVCWTNEDPTTHTVTSNAPGGFDSGPLADSESFRHTFTAEGSFPYDCAVLFHDMPGTVTVSASSPPPPPPPPPPAPPPPPPPPPGPPPPTPPPPPAPPPPGPQPHVHQLQLQGLRISVERRGRTRVLVARARLNRDAVARLALKRGARVRASARKRWQAGANTIRARLPRALPSGRWTAELRVGSLRFRRVVRIG